MTLPTVHLNGTSQAELESQLADAISAITEAGRALDLASPNARDYYPQGTEAWQAALVEHADRGRRLRSVANELVAILEGVMEGGAR